MKTCENCGIRTSFAAIALAHLGCGSPDAVGVTGISIESISQSEQGFESTTANGSARAVVKVERTGPRVDGFIRDADIDSPFESRISVFNRTGYPFLVNGLHDFAYDERRGGFDFALPAQPNQDEQLEDLRLAYETVKLLSLQPDIGERFRWELRTVMNFADHALDAANAVIDGRVVPVDDEQLTGFPRGAIGYAMPSGKQHAMNAAADGSLGLGTLSQAHSSPFIHNVAVKYGNCCWPGWEHSAVLVDSYYNDGHFVGTLSTRNHGREAVDPSLSVAAGCPRAYYGRPTSVPPLQPFVNTDTFADGDAGGCNTAYGVHVCNDDSYAEYGNAKYNTAYIWSECNAPATTAPSCY